MCIRPALLEEGVHPRKWVLRGHTAASYSLGRELQSQQRPLVNGTVLQCHSAIPPWVSGFHFNYRIEAAKVIGDEV
jgi:hypothetical protein